MDAKYTCPDCGGTSFRAYYLVDESQDCTLAIGKDGVPYADDYLGCTNGGDAREDEEYACIDCNHRIYLPQPARPAEAAVPIHHEAGSTAEDLAAIRAARALEV